MPVVATAVSAPKRASAPAAIASATGSDTAPCDAINAGSTPSNSALASFEYDTTPPAT
jgi:SHS family lactate transporter-like MFS transporter